MMKVINELQLTEPIMVKVADYSWPAGREKLIKKVRSRVRDIGRAKPGLYNVSNEMIASMVHIVGCK